MECDAVHNYLIKEGFTQSLADPCVYVCFVGDDTCIIIVIWVDDLIISASNFSLLLSVKDRLSSRFKMKDLGVLHWFFADSVQILIHGVIEMNQTRYIQKLLSRFRMTHCKPKATPSVLGLDKVTEAISPELARQSQYTLSIITSQLHCFGFQVFFSWDMHREAEHPSSTHARKKFWILINKYGPKLKTV